MTKNQTQSPSYLVKTPFYSYVIKYYNNNLGFRETKIFTLNKTGAKHIEQYIKTNKRTDFIDNLKDVDLNSIKIVGSFRKLMPIHFQIELTHSCNLACDYCYMNSKLYSKKLFNKISTSKLLDKLGQLRDKGVLEIGITGGEPTLHPDFDKISQYALKNFESVEIITNGVNYETIYNLIKLSNKYKHKLNLSMSFNMWYRNFDELWNNNFYIVKAIKKIKPLQPIRIICTDYKYSKKKTKIVEKKLLELGAKAVDYSYVSPIGRAKNKITEMYYINKYKQHKKNDKRVFTANQRNCGLLFKHSAIDPKGNIRPCALFSDQIVLGNIFTDKNIDDFISKNIKLYNLFAPNKIICKGCNFYDYCKGCIYKGLSNSNKNCNYKKYVKKEFPEVYRLVT